MAILSTSLLSTPNSISPPIADVTVNGVPRDSAVTVMFFCNLNTPDPGDPTVGRQNLNIYVVKNGDVYNNTNKIANQLPVDAGDTFTFSAERLVLSPGDKVYASTSTNNQVSVTISYVII